MPLTEEERKDYLKNYYHKNKDKIKDKSKKYREENKDKVAEYQKEYNEKNKDKISEYNKKYNKKYREENKEKERKRHQRYREENKDKRRETNKRYREENKDKISEYNKKYSKTSEGRRTKCLSNWKSHGIIFINDEHRDKIYKEYLENKECSYCGFIYEKQSDRCLDHNHSITDKCNIRGFLCRSCNFKDVLKDF